jgi:hypothetical protein
MKGLYSERAVPYKRGNWQVYENEHRFIEI